MILSGEEEHEDAISNSNLSSIRVFNLRFRIWGETLVINLMEKSEINKVLNLMEGLKEGK